MSAAECGHTFATPGETCPHCGQTTKTDRDQWADSAAKGGLFAYSLIMEGRREDVGAGLQALAATWFDEYEDEDDLPMWFHKAVEFAEGALGISLARCPDEDDE